MENQFPAIAGASLGTVLTKSELNEEASHRPGPLHLKRYSSWFVVFTSVVQPDCSFLVIPPGKAKVCPKNYVPQSK